MILLLVGNKGMDMTKIKQISPTPIRLPGELKAWLMRRAKSRLRSINSEVISMLLEEQRKEAEQGARREEPA